MGGGPKKPKEQPGYLSYLLRLWQVDPIRDRDQLDSKVWRGSLESSLSGERMGFANLEELLEFLLQQTRAVAEAEEEKS
jgi:hypothetical protein